MMKKLALLLAMSGVSFVANGAELLIEATYQESMGINSKYEATCKIYDNGKATVDLIQYDIASSMKADPKLGQNRKTIISTNTTFKIDKTFLKEAVNEAALEEFGMPISSTETFVYKNKQKMKVAYSPMGAGVDESKKLNMILIAMCNQHGVRKAAVGCGGWTC